MILPFYRPNLSIRITVKIKFKGSVDFFVNTLAWSQSWDGPITLWTSLVTNSSIFWSLCPYFYAFSALSLSPTTNHDQDGSRFHNHVLLKLTRKKVTKSLIIDFLTSNLWSSFREQKGQSRFVWLQSVKPRSQAYRTSAAWCRERTS